MATTTTRLVLASCQDCGGTFERAVGRRVKRCPNCRIAAVFAGGEHNRLKAGPEYERTVRGQLAHWTAEAKRLGLDE